MLLYYLFTKTLLDTNGHRSGMGDLVNKSSEFIQ